MRKLFLLTHMPGTGWADGKTRSEQPGWRAHAEFMNELAASGFIVLGGPVSDTEALLVIDAADEAEIYNMLADDPWHISRTLAVKEVREWTILLEHGQEHPS